jgi:hypothetical protein
LKKLLRTQGYGILATAAVLLLAGLVAFVGIFVFHVTRPLPPIDLATEYQAVLLSNGTVYFGKLEHAESAHPILRDVYYVQSQVDSKTKEVSNTLVKRGNEWHGPDHMVLNGNHILLLEPVTPDSTVSKLIAELKKRKSTDSGTPKLDAK